MKGEQIKTQSIKIPTNVRKFFRQYIGLMQPILNLTDREAEVFSELLYHSYLRRDIGNLQDRFTLVFESDTRIQIQEVLNISASAFRNYIMSLRKKGLIGKGNVIHPRFLIIPNGDPINITFTFEFKEE